MIPDFKTFLNERYVNVNYKGSSYYNFLEDTEEFIDKILYYYAKQEHNIIDEKDQWNWVCGIWDEFQENYEKENGENFDFTRDRHIGCYFSFYYDRGSYDIPPSGSVEISDVNFDEFNDIVEALQKYVTSDPNVGKYVKEHIKEFAEEKCDNKLNTMSWSELNDICH